MLTAGTVPEVGLAQRAGLDVARGIVVGPDLASPADARVFAIGDCAEPPEGGSGLIAQGWDQARRLATLLTEPSAARDDVPLPTVGTDVVKVKGVGLDVVAMGVCGPLTGGRRVRLSDPEGGRHIEVVVADGRVIGATCVGAGPVAADLVAAYTRGTPAPADPAQLLVRPVAGTAVPAASPTMMPDRAVVCRCNGVTKGDIVGCWRHGGRTVDDVAASTRATTGCGGCKDAVCGIVDWLRRSDPDQPAPSKASDDSVETRRRSPHADAQPDLGDATEAVVGSRSGDHDADRVVARRAVRDDVRDRARLRALRVGRADEELVLAGLRVPRPRPLPPRVDAAVVGQRRVVPVALVDAHLHPGDAAVLRPGGTGHDDRPGGDGRRRASAPRCATAS